MKIWIRSDLHCPLSDVHMLHSDPPAYDVQVLAGDVNYGVRRTIETIDAATDRPCVFVAGNHEHWRRTLDIEIGIGRDASRRAQHVRYLECGSWVHRGVRFLGATLWTDFSLYGPDARQVAMSHAKSDNPDFQLIMAREPSPLSVIPLSHVFRPEDAREIHLRTVAWLEERFAEPHDGPTVVVTHHAPSKLSIAPQWAGDPQTPGYVSDLAAKIERWQPTLWVHGHVHDSFDYRIGATRVVCNPRGFDLVSESYDPRLVVEV